MTHRRTTLALAGAAATLWLAAAPSAFAQLSFNATDFALSGSETPEAVVTSDFNGDGHLDLATAENGSDFPPDEGGVEVMLGDGTGNFTDFGESTAGDGPFALAAGEVDADTQTDLVVANNSSGNVSVLLGSGSGTFGAPTDFPSGTRPTAIIGGFFNADAHADLAVTNFIDQTVSVLLGKGDGTFSGPTTYPVGDGPDDVASGDLNGDGNLDLVVANSGGGSETASILLGRGDGTFRRPTDVEVGPNPNAVAVGDFNGDGVPDLAFSLAFFSSGGISILLGNGDGSFSAPSETQVGESTTSLAVADFNADSVLDLATTDRENSAVFVLPGQGNGTFSTPLSFPADGANDVATGNFDANPLPDMVTADTSPGRLTVLLNATPSPGAGPGVRVAAGGSCAPSGREGTITLALGAGDDALERDLVRPGPRADAERAPRGQRREPHAHRRAGARAQRHGGAHRQRAQRRAGDGLGRSDRGRRQRRDRGRPAPTSCSPRTAPTRWTAAAATTCSAGAMGPTRSPAAPATTPWTAVAGPTGSPAGRAPTASPAARARTSRSTSTRPMATPRTARSRRQAGARRRPSRARSHAAGARSSRTPIAAPGAVRRRRRRPPALHHLDLHKASGHFYTGPPPLPSVVGHATASAGSPDGRRVYFDATVAPYGSMAERALVPSRRAARRRRRRRRPRRRRARQHRPRRLARARLARGPAARGDGARARRHRRGRQRRRAGGEAARRRPRRRRRPRAGAADAAARARRRRGGRARRRRRPRPRALREAAGGDVDVTIDMLWGEPAVAAMSAAGRGARHVQVGQPRRRRAHPRRARSSARSRSTSAASRVAHPPIELRREAYLRLTEHVARGDIVVDVERVPLADVAARVGAPAAARRAARSGVVP